MGAALLSRSEQLLLPRSLYDAMIQHAQADLPNECCGLLAGYRAEADLRAEAILPLVNESASPVAYQSEPRSMFQADRIMRAAGHEMVAIYHSHPTSEPVPSRTDLAQYYSSDVVHFIIGLKNAEPELRGWWLTETTYAEAAWTIVDEPVGQTRAVD
jgi:proteasome lid subunit RPN8/RPN11